jgi:hypothetical protein
MSKWRTSGELHFGRCIVEMFYLVEHVKEIEV